MIHRGITYFQKSYSIIIGWCLFYGFLASIPTKDNNNNGVLTVQAFHQIPTKYSIFRSPSLLSKSSWSSNSVLKYQESTNYNEIPALQKQKRDENTYNNNNKSTKETKKKPTIYKHLFRHYGDISFDSWLRCTEPREFLLSVGYTTHELEKMSQTYPKLLELDVHSQLAPKIRFLVETLEGGTGRLTWQTNQMEEDEEECDILAPSLEEESNVPHSLRLFEKTKQLVPVKYFSPAYSLDRHIGPRHAYLASNQLNHGSDLLFSSSSSNKDGDEFGLFLEACRDIDDFVEICREWDNDYKHKRNHHTVGSVEEFERRFGPGLLPAAKKYPQLISQLIRHGANPFEYDSHGIVPLLWSAGSGNLEGFKSLLGVEIGEQQDQLYDDDNIDREYFYQAIDTIRDPKEGASAFHWACSGVKVDGRNNNNESWGPVFGGGGSFDKCSWMLQQVDGGKDDKGHSQRSIDLANQRTWTSQSTPIMWASWSGSLPIVQLLVLHKADVLAKNARNQTALHWAAAAGHLEICQYIVCRQHHHHISQHRDRHQHFSNSTNTIPTTMDLLFKQTDQSGNSPYDYAKLYDRQDVVDWMNGMILSFSPYGDNKNI